jgi:recombination protein RecT
MKPSILSQGEKEMKTDGSDAREKTAQQNGSPEDQSRKSLQKQVEAMATQFEHALPNKIGVERMMRIVMTAILNNPKLAQCEPQSFFGALLQALQLGLEVNTPLGQAWLIPRWDGKSKRYKCHFQMGYQGLMELCYRFGKYRRITAEIVYEGDIFEYEYGTASFIRHIPKYKSEKPIYVWALYEMDNGGGSFVVWSWDRVIKHAERYSESYDDEKKKWNFSAWSSDDESRESMAKKTLVDKVLTYAPKSVELRDALLADERSVIARPVNEGGETKFQLEIENKLPPAIEDDRDNPDRVKDQAPVATADPKAGKEKETVPANTKGGAGKAATQSPAPTAGNGNGSTGKNLFPDDEEQRLQEQYEREHSMPDFGK